MDSTQLTNFLGKMKSEQAAALAFQSEVNTQSMLFNSAKAALDAEKAAWDKVKG